MHYMPFGKYRNEDIRTIPTDYLLWTQREGVVRSPSLAQAIHEEIQRRYARYQGQESQQTQDESGDDEDAWESSQHAPQGTNSNRGKSGSLRREMTNLARTWFREMARRWHPDRGGSNDAMRAINDAHEFLLQLIEDASTDG